MIWGLVPHFTKQTPEAQRSRGNDFPEVRRWLPRLAAKVPDSQDLANKDEAGTSATEQTDEWGGRGTDGGMLLGRKRPGIDAETNKHSGQSYSQAG